MAYARLSPGDLLNLAVEAGDTPMNVAALLVLEGGGLRDAAGRLRLSAIRADLARRLAGVPRLRQVPYRPGPLGGRPLWIDAAAFDIADHVNEVVLAPPADEPALLRLCAALVTRRLDRDRPLWRLWFVTGLPGDRVAVVIVLHHVVADGLAALELIATFLGPVPDQAPPAPASMVAPRWRELAADAARTRLARLRRAVRAIGRGSPRSVGRELAGVGRVLARSWRAPRTSLNAPLGPRRQLVVCRFDLADARRVAHRHGGTVNDLLLSLAAGGVRALLRSRGEPVDGRWPHATVAVSLRRPGVAAAAGNRTGGLVVRLPVGVADPGRRLELVAAETARAKGGQRLTTGNTVLIGLARLGLVRWFSRHQRLTNLMTSDVVGPPEPIRLLGARVVDLVPIGGLAGNLAISVLALSYAGRLTVTVQTDPDVVPDVATFVAIMRREWAALSEQQGADARGQGQGGRDRAGPDEPGPRHVEAGRTAALGPQQRGQRGPRRDQRTHVRTDEQAE
jgi:WS/DGAT/MGAT family acyltransferase